MKRVFAFGSALALVIVTACVGDHSLIPNAKAEADASADGGATSDASSPGPTGQPNLCGSLMENGFPSCPGVGTNDTGCTDTTTACCPGDACVKADTTTCAHAPSKPFLCFAGPHCNDAPPFSKRCCAPATLVDDPKRSGCDEPKQLKMEATASTTCADTCAGGEVQLCKLGSDGKIDPHELACPGSTICTRTIIAVPNPKGGEPFLRAVGACR